MNMQTRPIAHDEQYFLDLLERADSRERELERLYVEGKATPAQLIELEKVRADSESALEALDIMGYFNPS